MPWAPLSDPRSVSGSREYLHHTFSQCPQPWTRMCLKGGGVAADLQGGPAGEAPVENNGGCPAKGAAQAQTGSRAGGWEH